MNYRKIGFLVLPFLFAANTAYAGVFPDVPEDDVHYKAIEYLKSQGIIQGYADGTFQPDKPINRVEALKIILLSTDTVVRTEFEIENTFPDVASDQWFFNYVMEAMDQKIVAGYGDGTFKPDSQINLAETLKMATLALGMPLEKSDSDNWYDQYLDFGLSKNIILLSSSGEVFPDELMTRAKFAEVLYRLAFMKKNSLQVFPLSQDWDYYEKAADYYKLKVPYGWQIREENTRTILWLKMESQLDYYRLTPESATLILHKKDNVEGVEKELMFQQITDLTNQSFYPNEVKKTEITISDMLAVMFEVPALNIRDYYVYMPNSKILVAYGATGNGKSKDQNMRFIEAAVKNITFLDSGQVDESAEKAELKKKINQNLLVEGVGLSTINSLPDSSLFETDAIGVGTGPVDYYYSQYLNLTLKYERESDVILNTRDGKTSKF